MVLARKVRQNITISCSVEILSIRKKLEKVIIRNNSA